MSDPNQTVDESGQEQTPPGLADATLLPERIGRYRVERVLGQGGFGLVYLAQDEQLNRSVAIKVPHAHLVAQAGSAEAYLTEARIVASLDHPNIVLVHDVGSTDPFPCFIVSKYIDGTDLATRLKQSRLSIPETVELVATVAEALHHAHKQGLVHRDIKPGNILLDRTGKPFVADFGLALREQDVGKGSRYAGTAAYMSPEQARGEGHRVDGRSDIFSLGVVFYELLVGRQPFRADSQADLMEQVTSFEPRPPRQVDGGIPKELDRICLKALSKRASERYSTAKDLGDDLRHFLAESSLEERAVVTGRAMREADPTTLMRSPVPTPSEQQAIKIVPKGLRSFDSGDADYFLELLPGPRDRDGLPESIRFWKTRIETTNPDSTFSVGLIYGPSGCGKSSLVKAGLLPRLAKTVTAVYVEAIAEETEARLLKGLRRQVANLPGNLGLAESLAVLRQGRFLESGRKVLLVLDQFEQWLHAERREENTELVQALRQCDGGRVHCVVLVRDDFWLAVSRFMQALEIRLLEGENSRLVDLFDPRHARKVLAAFGRAFGALPELERRLTKEQDAFLDQAVAGLAQDGKVISVRLALFAEMTKGKLWTPATLKEVGGTEGVGVTFLEETFSASTAPPQHRLHQKAAQIVLKALLPESGTDIKGHMRSQQELLEASGYASRPRDFDDLLRILDGELRLITPTDPEGVEGGGWSVAGTDDPPSASPSTHHPPPSTRYYQLTHDYLVPSLRDWLTRKQKETRRGRAELLLADRASVWNARPENRQLPSPLQWWQIRGLTRKKTWTPPQRKMMLKAGRYHAVRGLALALLLALLGWLGYEGHGRLQAQALRGRLLDANTNEVPAIVQEMAPYRRWLDPLLREANHEAEANQDARKQLHTSLALLPVDPGQFDYLYQRLLNASPQEIRVVRDALKGQQDTLVKRLQNVLASPQEDPERRLRAACALAGCDVSPDEKDEGWQAASPVIANQVLAAVQKNPSHYPLLVDLLRPVRARLLRPLAEVFRSKERPDAERSFATSILAEYAADQPAVLADLLMDGEAKQFGVLYPKFEAQGERGLVVLTAEVDRKLSPGVTEDAKEKVAKRQANAAVALLRMKQPAKVWPLLRHSPDPRVRSYLIHRLGPLGAAAGALVQRLADEPDVTIRRALILSLGPEEFAEGTWRPEEKQRLVEQLQEIYRRDADPGLHAAEWLLRQWHEEAWLVRTDQAWAMDRQMQAPRLTDIKQVLAKDKDRATPQWYVTGQGQTMVVVPGPVEFVMGSPEKEMGRNPTDEVQHNRRIGRTFALAAKPVTLAQYRKFNPRYGLGEIETWARKVDSPVIGTGWFQAAAYCNWLSQQEGLPPSEWCYEPLDCRPGLAGSSVGLLAGSMGPLAATCGLFPGRTDPEYAYREGMKLARNYLRRSGYRLPTEAEWEYACRAGAATSRYFGEAAELLEKYAWHQKNGPERTWPVGSKKPNDLGLFDMHGNVWCWYQERYQDYPKRRDSVVEDKEDILDIKDKDSRVMRGGSFGDRASLVRCAYRARLVPTIRLFDDGFRPARTCR